LQGGLLRRSKEVWKTGLHRSEILNFSVVTQQIQKKCLFRWMTSASKKNVPKRPQQEWNSPPSSI